MRPLLGPDGCEVPHSVRVLDSGVVLSHPPPGPGRSEEGLKCGCGLLTCVPNASLPASGVASTCTHSGAPVTNAGSGQDLVQSWTLTFGIQCRLTSPACLAPVWLPGCVASSIHDDSTPLSPAQVSILAPSLPPAWNVFSLFCPVKSRKCQTVPPPGSLRPLLPAPPLWS